jgi:hypothetical protein
LEAASEGNTASGVRSSFNVLYRDVHSFCTQSTLFETIPVEPPIVELKKLGHRTRRKSKRIFTRILQLLLLNSKHRVDHSMVSLQLLFVIQISKTDNNSNGIEQMKPSGINNLFLRSNMYVFISGQFGPNSDENPLNIVQRFRNLVFWMIILVLLSATKLQSGLIFFQQKFQFFVYFCDIR